MTALIFCLVHSTLSMITAYDDAAHGFNVHYDCNHSQRQINLIEYSAEEYQKYTDITAQTEYLAMNDPVAHETVVFVRRITQHEGTDDCQKSNE